MKLWKLILVVLLGAFFAVSSFAQSVVSGIRTDESVKHWSGSAIKLPDVSFAKPQADNGGSPFSIGFVYAFGGHGGGLKAVGFNDFRNFSLINGKPTELWWSGGLGTSVDKEGKAIGVLGIHWVHRFLKEAYAGGFIGAQLQGGSAFGGAIGFDIGVKFEPEP